MVLTLKSELENQELNLICLGPTQLLRSYSRSNHVFRGNENQTLVFPTDVHSAPNFDGKNGAARTASCDMLKAICLSRLFVELRGTEKLR